MSIVGKIGKFIGLLCLLNGSALAQLVSVHFRVEGVTAGQLQEGIYLAGNINGWRPDAANYRFGNDARLTLHVNAGTGLEFKLTRGHWNQAECQQDGTALPNRRLVVASEDTTVYVPVAAWSDAFVPSRVSTATVSVQALRDSVFFPHANRYVPIRIYLPVHALAAGQQRFPLLLMTDGQNLFDAQTAFSGEWGVDETLDSMKAEVVVAGIDHAGSDRLKEYSIGKHSVTGEGYGAQWLQWLADSVLPFLRKHYPVTAVRQNTWIAGSSMGGLISSWAMLLQANTFGGAGVFSPAYQLADTFFTRKPTLQAEPSVCVWWYAGGDEATWMLPVTERVYQAWMGSARATSYTSDVLGRHEEAAWRRRFPEFVRFMVQWLVPEPYVPGK